MAGFNLRVFKQGSPWLWIGGALVLFVAFYMLASKGAPKSGASGAVSYIDSGPSEAELAAQLQMAGIQAQANSDNARVAGEIQLAATQMQGQLALATIAAGNETARLAVDRDLGALALTTDSENQRRAIDAQLDSIALQAQYGTEQARIATQGSLQALQMQGEMQRDFFNTQSKSLTQQALIAQVGTLKKKNRDEVLIELSRRT